MKVFLSYTRVKDTFQEVTKFRKHLAAELQMSEHDSTIFQDTENMEEGDHFSEVLISELNSSDVLLILVSPSWLQSKWCRCEIKIFSEHLKNQERIHCIVPVLWCNTPELYKVEESKDPIVSLLKPILYTNWTNLRHKKWDSQEKKVGLNKLADAILKKSVTPSATKNSSMESHSPVHHLPANSPFPNIDQKLNPCQVTVCFVDIKGFDHFSMSDTQDNIVAQVVTLFYQAINSALEHALNNVSSEIRSSPEFSHFVPSITKPLGDGAMLVWELPEQPESIVRKLVCRFVLDFFSYLQLLFNLNVRKLTHDNMIREPLVLVAGLTRGMAWKMVGTENDRFDYVGAIIKEAAKLQRAAVANEILIHLKFEPDLLMERLCLGEGAIRRFPQSQKKYIPIWSSIGDTQDAGRCQLRWRRHREASIDSAMACLQPLPDIKYNLNGIPNNPLTENDTETIFESRQRLEALFTSEMALKVKNGEYLSDGEEIESLEHILKEMEDLIPKVYGELSGDKDRLWKSLGVKFHSEIARLSTSVVKTSQLRKSFTTDVYERTRSIYIDGTTKSNFHLSDIAKEHRCILKYVKKGEDDTVKQYMEDHLSTHYERAREYLLNPLSFLPSPLPTTNVTTSDGIVGLAIRSVARISDRELVKTLESFCDSQIAKETTETAERVFKLLTSNKWPTETLCKFISGWNSIHGTALFVSGLLVRLHQEAEKNRLDHVTHSCLLNVAMEISAVISEDTGIDGPMHQELFEDFAHAVVGKGQWRLEKYAMPKCREFRKFVKEQRLKAPIEQSILITMASELWNTGEYTYLNLRIRPWLRKHLGYSDDKIEVIAAYVDAHAGETESDHFLNVINAWDSYCRATHQFKDLNRLTNTVEKYFRRIGASFEELERLFKT